MQYWINRTLSTQNVVQLSSDALMIASCSESKLDQIANKLKRGSHLVELVGSDEFTAIPLAAVISLRGTDDSASVELDYVGMVGELQQIRFATPAVAAEAAQQIGHALGSDYRYQTQRRNEIVAAAPAWVSFSIAWLFGLIYFKHAPWLVSAVGGVWMLLSLLALARSMMSTAVVHRWTVPAQASRSSAWSNKRWRTWLLLLAAFFAVFFLLPHVVSNTPLHDYVVDGGADDEAIDDIINRGFDIDLDDGGGQTALDWALEFDNHVAARKLIERGAEFQQSNPTTYSTVELAFGDPDDSDIALLMLQHGLGANFTTSEGVGLLAIALRSYQSPALVKALLEKGADPRQLVEGVPAIEYVVRHEYSDHYLNPLLDAVARQ